MAVYKIQAYNGDILVKSREYSDLFTANMTYDALCSEDIVTQYDGTYNRVKFFDGDRLIIDKWLLTGRTIH